jgi:radical SAM protein with 4Fe4S-binding SPASM domain
VQYSQDAPASENPDKSPDRTDDGTVSSLKYAEQSRYLRRAASGTKSSRAEPDEQTPPARSRSRLDSNGTFATLDYHHPLEDWLARKPVRWLLGWLSRPRPNGKTVIEEIIQSYANPAAPGSHRFGYWPFHRVIDWIKGSTTADAFRTRVGQHASTIRGLVVTARSVAEFGLTLPQRFSAPLFCVWNFTNRCNLACQHCYQDSAHRTLADELTLDEKLDVVDQAGAAYMPMIAFAGGEPTISPDLLPVLKRCQSYGIHTSVATNGTMMTPRLAGELAAAGVKYVEISLDSTDPAKHDAFRGQPGMWQRTVNGMRTVVATPGLRLGLAMCVHQGNFGEVERMLQFAVDIGASCVAHFNFIPVGRGLNMVHGDLTPVQREWLLRTLNDWMQSGRIGVLSTAPQLGRVCLAHAPVDVGRMSASHAGSGGGEKARVVAKYLGGCGAGRCYVCVEPNGNITPCVYLPHRVIGNIRQRTLMDIFRNNDYWDLLCDRERRTGHCEVCHFKHFCGGCRARSDAYYGTLNGADPGCMLNEQHWKQLVADGVAVEPAGQGHG